MAYHENGEPDLGTCCVCGERGPQVRNVLMLQFRAPVAGTGWGCFTCGLPNDGAVAVVCDGCLTKPVVQICYGFAAKGGRAPMPLDAEKVAFGHIMSRHEPLN